MFFTYLRRELVGRRRQTAIVASGMAVAIALVVLVNSVSSGVDDAQRSVLSSIYGVGTDMTVAPTATEPDPDAAGRPGRFEFGSDAGETADGSTTVATSRLSAGFTATMDAAALATIADLDGVSDASAALKLTNTTFSGELPDPADRSARPEPGSAPTGGADGAGGSAFDVDSYSVLGIDPAAVAVGPLSAVTVVDGRSLEAADAGQSVALVDETYATSAGIAVGDSVDAGGTALTVVGIVGASSASATTAAQVYLPLDLAQSISGQAGMISEVYVQAANSTQIDEVSAAIAAALPDATVSTEADLASSVSGSLSTASDLIGKLGVWLSIGVLAAAFLLAILFTVSGVSRRTREFGTLKAIGWSNGRIVRQVAGESLVQGIIGGAIGVAVGAAAVAIVNAAAVTLSGTTVTAAGQAGGGVRGFGPAPAAQTPTEIVLAAPFSPEVMLTAVGLAVLGGLLAGAVGGWRASSLRPAAALRSVA